MTRRWGSKVKWGKNIDEGKSVLKRNSVYLGEPSRNCSANVSGRGEGIREP